MGQGGGRGVTGPSSLSAGGADLRPRGSHCSPSGTAGGPPAPPPPEPGQPERSACGGTEAAAVASPVLRVQLPKANVPETQTPSKPPWTAGPQSPRRDARSPQAFPGATTEPVPMRKPSQLPAPSLARAPRCPGSPPSPPPPRGAASPRARGGARTDGRGRGAYLSSPFQKRAGWPCPAWSCRPPPPSAAARSTL